MEPEHQDLAPFALYVNDRADAEHYRNELQRLGVATASFVIQIVSGSEMRLPAIRTRMNLYEGPWSVNRVLSSLVAR
jgi:hypothetical protein